MDSKSDNDKFGPDESQKRFEAALKGARLAGHKPMESLTRTKAKKQRKKPTKKRKT